MLLTDETDWNSPIEPPVSNENRITQLSGVKEIHIRLNSSVPPSAIEVYKTKKVATKEDI